MLLNTHLLSRCTRIPSQAILSRSSWLSWYSLCSWNSIDSCKDNGIKRVFEFPAFSSCASRTYHIFSEFGGHVWWYRIAHLWDRLDLGIQFQEVHVHPFLLGNLATLGLPAGLCHLPPTKHCVLN